MISSSTGHSEIITSSWVKREQMLLLNVGSGGTDLVTQGSNTLASLELYHILECYSGTSTSQIDSKLSWPTTFINWNYHLMVLMKFTKLMPLVLLAKKLLRNQTTDKCPVCKAIYFCIFLFVKCVAKMTTLKNTF